MIRQAISCDICGTEMQHPNHWFVAQQIGTELRISGWNSRKRLRTGDKHLCGQKCLHQLADDFMAAVSHERVTSVATETATEPLHSRRAPVTDASLTSPAAHAFPQRPVASTSLGEFESSARVIAPPAPIVGNSRAEAWKRERERQRATDQPRRSIA